MSSPAPGGGGPQFRPLGRAPPVSNRARDAANNTRAMGLKVLYNIDDGNNTNCLARWPDVLSIQTAAIDERTVIGIVELKVAIQAVVQSSPELISRVGRDYTVYAYDYSEFDVPQSGQGMLSWALAQDAPSQPVTGRVCKNVLGLFSKGSQETLEVKLRLVPVTTAHQNEYLSSMEKARQSSAQADNFEWNTLMSAQGGVVQMNRSFSAQTVSANQPDGVSRDEFNQIVNPGGIMVGGRASTPTNRGKGKGSQTKTSRPPSRTGVKRPRGRPPRNSVVPSDNVSGSEDVGTDGDDAPPKKRVKPSGAERDVNSTFGDPESLRIRASTAASIRGDMRPKPANLGMNAGIGAQELPRAPTPVPKFPHPISTRAPSLLQSSLRRESLPSPGGARPYNSPYQEVPIDSSLGSERVHPSIESAMTSPECQGSPVQTPQDIGSSPPVLTSLRASIPPPSSPILPQMRRGADSTYGGSGGLFGDDDEDDDLCLIPVDDDCHRMTARPNNAEQEKSGERENQPTTEGPAQINKAGSPAASTTSQDENTLPAHKHMTQMSRPNSSHSQQNIVVANINSNQAGTQYKPVSEGSVSLSLPPPPPPPISNRAPPARAQSFSALTNPESSSIAENMSNPSYPPRSQTAGPSTVQDDRADSEPPANGRNVAKKARIMSKLEQAVAEGTEPDFCFNCGAIETPTWRKAFVQDHLGRPDFMEYSDEPGHVMTCTILTKDKFGNVLSYRIFKKSLAHTENFADFKEIMLCNPCGIWVAKYKAHRPSEHWGVPASIDGPPRKKQRVRGKRRSQEKKQQNGDTTNPTSEAPAPSDYLYSESNFQSDFQSEANLPQSEAPGMAFSPPLGGRDSNQMSREQSASNGYQTEFALSLPTQNGNNSLASTAAMVAKNPAGRSSPSGVREGSRKSPIDLESEFGSTRRLLFPSPRKDGSPKTLGELQTSNVIHTPQPSGNFQSQKEHSVQTNFQVLIDKENLSPRNGSENGSISELFGEKETPARPVTPTQQSNSPPPNTFKTPTRPTPNHRPITRSQSKSTSATKATIASIQKTPTRTPRRSPRHNPDVLETPMTYMNRMFSQSNNQTNATSENNAGNLDNTAGWDFELPDVDLNDLDISFDGPLFAGAGFRDEEEAMGYRMHRTEEEGIEFLMQGNYDFSNPPPDVPNADEDLYRLLHGHVTYTRNDENDKSGKEEDKSGEGKENNGHEMEGDETMDEEKVGGGGDISQMTTA